MNSNGQQGKRRDWLLFDPASILPISFNVAQSTIPTSDTAQQGPDHLNATLE
jgi:hypothetical protein